MTKRFAGVGLVARLGPSAIFGPTLYDLYCSTEAEWVSVPTADDMAQRAGSVGRPIPGVDVAIFREDGSRARAGRTRPHPDRRPGGVRRLPRRAVGRIGADRRDVGRLDRDGYL